MTNAEAQIWNAAIKAAINAYPKGIGAIKALQVREVITVEHVERGTK